MRVCSIADASFASSSASEFAAGWAERRLNQSRNPMARCDVNLRPSDVIVEWY